MLDELMRWIGLGLCHQLPERSFFGGGVQLPVCARDTGIYVGFAIALLVLWAIDRDRRSSEVPPVGVSLVLGGFILLMALDGFTSYAGWRPTTNGLRLATGLMTGFAMAAFTVPLLNSQLWRRPGTTRVLGSWRQLAWFVLVLTVVFVLVWTGGPLLGIGYPIITALAIFVTFVAVNAVIVALFPPFERHYERLLAAWPVFAVALIITLVELASTAWLRVWLNGIAGS